LFELVVFGAGVGLAGAIVAIIHFAKRLPFKGLAILGFMVSLIGTALDAKMGFLYRDRAYITYKVMDEERDEERKARDEERKARLEEYFGKPAPEVVMKTIDGNEIELSKLKGKRVMLVFWGIGCMPCRQEIPHLIELRKTTDVDKLVIIGISADPANKIREFGEKMKINYPLVSISHDENLPEPFNKVTAIPTIFFIDADGIIENTLIGCPMRSKPFEVLKKHALRQAGKIQE
jgi:peroxiredoxin